MRRRRLAITAPSGLLVALAVFLAFAQIGAALVDGHGAQLDARTHGRTRKWKGRQLIGLDVNASLLIPAPTLLGTPVSPAPSSTIASPSTTPTSAASSAASTIASSLPVSTPEASVASSAHSSSVVEASTLSLSASSADKSATPVEIISSPSSAPSASPTTSPNTEASIVPISSALEATPSSPSAKPSLQETSAPIPIAPSAIESPAPVESSPTASPSAAPTPAVSEPAPSSIPSAPSAAPSASAVDNQPSIIISLPSPEASSPPPSEPATSAPESSPTPSPTSAAAVVESSNAASPASSDGGLINISIGIGESSVEPPQNSLVPTGVPAPIPTGIDAPHTVASDHPNAPPTGAATSAPLSSANAPSIPSAVVPPPPPPTQDAHSQISTDTGNPPAPGPPTGQSSASSLGSAPWSATAVGPNAPSLGSIGSAPAPTVNSLGGTGGSSTVPTPSTPFQTAQAPTVNSVGGTGGSSTVPTPSTPFQTAQAPTVNSVGGTGGSLTVPTPSTPFQTAQAFTVNSLGGTGGSSTVPTPSTPFQTVQAPTAEIPGSTILSAGSASGGTIGLVETAVGSVISTDGTHIHTNPFIPASQPPLFTFTTPSSVAVFASSMSSDAPAATGASSLGSSLRPSGPVSEIGVSNSGSPLATATGPSHASTAASVLESSNAPGPGSSLGSSGADTGTGFLTSGSPLATATGPSHASTGLLVLESSNAPGPGSSLGSSGVVTGTGSLAPGSPSATATGPSHASTAASVLESNAPGPGTSLGTSGAISGTGSQNSGSPPTGTGPSTLGSSLAASAPSSLLMPLSGVTSIMSGVATGTGPLPSLASLVSGTDFSGSGAPPASTGASGSGSSALASSQGVTSVLAASTAANGTWDASRPSGTSDQNGSTWSPTNTIATSAASMSMSGSSPSGSSNPPTGPSSIPSSATHTWTDSSASVEHGSSVSSIPSPSTGGPGLAGQDPMTLSGKPSSIPSHSISTIPFQDYPLFNTSSKSSTVPASQEGVASTPAPSGPPASSVVPSGPVGSSQQTPSPSPSWASVPSQVSTGSSASDVILHPEPSSVGSRPSPVFSSASTSFGLPSPSISADQPVSTGDAVISSGHPTASGTYGATVPIPSASESSGGSVIPSGVASDSNSFSLIGTVSAPNPNGTQVLTYTASAVSASSSASAPDWQQSSHPVVASSSFNDAYTPSQTWLIVATSAVQSSAPTQQIATPTITQAQASGGPSSPSLPATASIPSSVPTLIVPANSVVRQANVGTGSNDDPVKDDVLISLLLSEDNFPWVFVVKSSDATSQLFNTFPSLIAGALNIPESDIKTYGLMVYQPASWNGLETSLLTQWLAYIPKSQFDTLSAYLRTSNSPLFNQPGIKGQLAAQINTAYPLAATTGNSETTSHETDGGGNSKKRNIVIGVCVAVGGLLWVGLVFWIYKRVKRSNDKAVHRRLSEHMSMFDGGNHATYGAAHENRLSRAVSIAASDIDDRPSSFYASPLDNDRSFRQYQRERSSDALASVRTGASLGHDTPNNYGPSVFGNSWFANPNQGPPQSRTRGQNPFEDMVQQSFLNTSGSNGNIQHHVAAQRRSQAVQKGMISQPTLQAHSLEFGKEF